MIVLVIEKDATKSDKSSVPYGRANVSGILDAMMNTRTDSDLMAAYADACDGQGTRQDPTRDGPSLPQPIQGVSLTLGHHWAAILTFIPASGIILPMETTQDIQDIQATPDLLDRALKLSGQLKQEVERELTLQA